MVVSLFIVKFVSFVMVCNLGTLFPVALLLPFSIEPFKFSWYATFPEPSVF